MLCYNLGAAAAKHRMDTTMQRLKASLITIGLTAGASIALAGPVTAQDKGGDKVNMVIAYDESECPEAADNEIVICEILVEA